MYLYIGLIHAGFNLVQVYLQLKSNLQNIKESHHGH